VSRFQYSSASRKFLNPRQRRNLAEGGEVSVLFSEPKIPQLDLLFLPHPRAHRFQYSSASRKFLNVSAATRTTTIRSSVSVLFSEPKIPQPTSRPFSVMYILGFSTLQRAENSSTRKELASERAAEQ